MGGRIPYCGLQETMAFSHPFKNRFSRGHFMRAINDRHSQITAVRLMAFTDTPLFPSPALAKARIPQSWNADGDTRVTDYLASLGYDRFSSRVNPVVRFYRMAALVRGAFAAAAQLGYDFETPDWKKFGPILRGTGDHTNVVASVD